MKKSLLLIILSVLAILNSSYLLFLHYTPHDVAFCDPTEAFNCETVNKSIYSTIDGNINHILGTNINLPIPNALISIIVFLGIFLLALQIYYNKYIISKKYVILKLKSVLILSFLFALYLVYIEAFVLFSWCLFCIILDVIIILALILALSIKN
tara:strand:- start:25 stop:486 length:462 start_codon:yes stop_codon:yes gene_type:complete